MANTLRYKCEEPDTIVITIVSVEKQRKSESLLHQTEDIGFNFHKVLTEDLMLAPILKRKTANNCLK